MYRIAITSIIPGKLGPSILLVVYLLATGVFISALLTMKTVTADSQATPVPMHFTRGMSGDSWADTIIGKPDFGAVSPYTTVPNKLFWTGGNIVDRADPTCVSEPCPEYLYEYDSGNNRVLGFDLSGTNGCLLHFGDPLYCSADLVIGQPDFYSSGCNRDSGFQNWPFRTTATNKTLCGQPEHLPSISEGGSIASMDVDDAGNLYVPDFFNSRVLKYESPFASSTVTANIAAVDVWGKGAAGNDFADNRCNKVLDYATGDPPPSPDATNLCFSWGNSNDWTAGVDWVRDNGTGGTQYDYLWVADSGNNRVLRYSKDPASGSITHTADVVLGQPNFTSNARSSASNPPLNRLNGPDAVRVNNKGWVYVADEGNNRVLVFTPTNTTLPYTYTLDMNGQLLQATGTPDPDPEPFWGPMGIDFDPAHPGDVWIMNTHYRTVERWPMTPTITTTVGTPLEVLGQRGNGNLINSSGSMGIDSAGNRFVSVRAEGTYQHDIIVFGPTWTPTTTPSKRFFGETQVGNARTGKGLASASGLAVTTNVSPTQLIVADRGRILFWNNPSSVTSTLLTNGQLANGVTGPGVITFTDWTSECCLAMKADKSGHLWVSVAGANRVEVYNLPLTTAATPTTTIAYPFTTIDGTPIPTPTSGQNSAFWGLAPTDNGDYLWLSHTGTDRVFRIRDPLTTTRKVDVILGQADPTSASCNAMPQPVTWSKETNVTTNYSTTNGITLKKTGGSGSAWDAGASSSAAIPAQNAPWGGYVSMTVDSTLYDRMFGLSHGDDNQNYTDVDHAFFMSNTGALQIYESGTRQAVTSTWTYTVGDKLRVEVSYDSPPTNTFKYYQNNTLLFSTIITRTDLTPTFPLLLDTAFKDSGGQITNAYILGAPGKNNLCLPGSLSLDRLGNLYVSDHSLEVQGNYRLLGYSASLFPVTNTVTYSPPSSKIFPNTSSWEPTFDSLNRMVVGYNGLNGSPSPGPPGYAGHFPGIYGDPLSWSTTPDALLNDFYSNAMCMTFDPYDNLYVGDHNRARALIYKHPGTCEPVTWTAGVNVTITGNTIQKTGGTEGQWDTGAVSTRAILSGDGYVAMTADSTAYSRMFGLSNSDSDQNYPDIDFALSATNQSSRLDVVEGGTIVVQGVSTYTVSDTLKVAIENGTVKYYKNDTLLYTSGGTPHYPLLVDTSIGNSNGKVYNAYLCGSNLGTAVIWTALVNVGVTGTLTNTIQKTGGTEGQWDSGAVSAQAIMSGNGSITVNGDTASGYSRMFGLSNYDTDQHYNDIDYALWASGSGEIYVYENGTSRGLVGNYVVSDTFRVAVENGKVKYYKNNTLLYTNVTPTLKYPLLLDTSIGNSNGKVFNAYIGGSDLGTAVVWTNLVNASTTGSIGNTIKKTGGSNGLWDTGGTSTKAIQSGSDGYVSAVVTGSTTYSLALGLSNGNSGENVTDIDFALVLSNSGYLEIWEAPSSGQTAVPVAISVTPYLIGDNLKVAIEGGVVRYFRNNSLLYTSSKTPTYPLQLDSSLANKSGQIYNTYIGGKDVR